MRPSRTSAFAGCATGCRRSRLLPPGADAALEVSGRVQRLLVFFEGIDEPRDGGVVQDNRCRAALHRVRGIRTPAGSGSARTRSWCGGAAWHAGRRGWCAAMRLVPKLWTVTTRPTPAPKYRRRDPEASLLHRIVRENLESFLAAAEEEGRPVPLFVEEEFRNYLKCGVLAHGCSATHYVPTPLHAGGGAGGPAASPPRRTIAPGGPGGPAAAHRAAAGRLHHAVAAVVDRCGR